MSACRMPISAELWGVLSRPGTVCHPVALEPSVPESTPGKLETRIPRRSSKLRRLELHSEYPDSLRFKVLASGTLRSNFSQRTTVRWPQARGGWSRYFLLLAGLSLTIDTLNSRHFGSDSFAENSIAWLQLPFGMSLALETPRTTMMSILSPPREVARRKPELNGAKRHDLQIDGW
jgi:hypothetical protein